MHVTCDDPVAAAVLLPGAGGTFAAAGLTFLADLFACHGVNTTLINMPHNQRGGPPSSIRRAGDQFAAIMDELAPGDLPYIVGGKSFGARVALTYAASRQAQVHGVVAYGFPLHAPGKDQWRDDMFSNVTQPGLFISGSRDPFGTPQELANALTRYRGDATHIVVAGGDHDCAVAGKYAATGVRQTPHVALSPYAEAIATWLAKLTRQA